MTNAPTARSHHMKYMTRVQRPDGRQMGWQDLRVGGSVTLYGRRFEVIGCDAASRRWLSDQGTPPAADEDWPEGPYDIAKKQARVLTSGHAGMVHTRSLCVHACVWG